MVLLFVLRECGPFFPVTLLFAPIAVLVELLAPSTADVWLLLAGGPLLYGLYGSLLALRARRRNLSIAAAAHLVCFLITLWQRAVI